MSQPHDSPVKYQYGLDDRPPLSQAILCGFQWALVTFPFAVIATKVCGAALGLGPAGSIRFMQLTLLVAGLFTVLQTLLGHRFPLVEGPSTAVFLTFILLVPFGLPAVQGGMIVGGLALLVLVLTKQLKRVIALFTPNVVGVIVMLVAFGLLPPVIRFITGVDSTHPQGQVLSTLVGLGLVLFIGTLSYWLGGFWKTLASLIGMAVGTLVFLLLGHISGHGLATSPWVSFSTRWVESIPGFYWPAALAMACTYVAVIVNSLGSLQGIGAVTDDSRLPRAIPRGIFMNGVSGIVCGILGIAGTVSFSWGAGMVLLTRVASRFVVTYCGLILLLTAFLPKLAALLALVPSAVVGAALFIALGGQVGVAISIITAKGITSRDHFVVGIPVLLGTFAGFLPSGLLELFPKYTRVFLGDSIIVGIVAVLLLEHVLMRDVHGRKEAPVPKT